MTVTYTDPAQVNSIVRDLPPALPLKALYDHSQSWTPTCYRIRYGNRWHRVYATCYSNASSAFIRKGGQDLYLDIDTEYAITDGLPSDKLGI